MAGTSIRGGLDDRLIGSLMGSPPVSTHPTYPRHPPYSTHFFTRVLSKLPFIGGLTEASFPIPSPWSYLSLLPYPVQNRPGEGSFLSLPPPPFPPCSSPCTWGNGDSLIYHGAVSLKHPTPLLIAFRCRWPA